MKINHKIFYFLFCKEKKTTRPQHTCPLNENVILCLNTCSIHNVQKREVGQVNLTAFLDFKNVSLPPGETKGCKGSPLTSYLPLTGKSLEMEKS